MGRLIMKALLVTLMVFGLVGCKPPVDDTEFNKVQRSGAESDETQIPDPGPLDGVCDIHSDYEPGCIKDPDCQGVYDENGAKFLSCIESPLQLPEEEIIEVVEDIMDDDKDEQEPEMPQQQDPDMPQQQDPDKDEMDDVVDEMVDEMPMDEAMEYCAKLKDEDEDDSDEDDDETRDPARQDSKSKAKHNTKVANKKVAVCHIPPGNPENLKTICISINGYEHGHKDRHGNEESHDHLGACTQRELDTMGADQ